MVPQSFFFPFAAVEVLLLAWFGAVVQGQTLHTREAVEPSAKLLDFGNTLQFSISGELQEIPIEQLVRWGSWPGIRSQPAAWLSDGSWVAGDLDWEGGQLNIQSDWLSCPPVDATLVRGFVLQPPVAMGKWNRLRQEMEQADGEEDHVWLESGAKLRGVLELESLVSPDNEIVIEVDEKRLELQAEQIMAVVFSPTLLGEVPDTPARWVGLKDGTLLRWQQLGNEEEVSGAGLRFDIAAPLRLQAYDSPKEFAKAVRYLAGSPTGMQRLSDLPVAQFKHVDDGLLRWELGINRDCYQRPLMVRENWLGSVETGLALHSTSQVAYRHDASKGKLLAEVRLAEPPSNGAHRLGSAKCRVLIVRGGQLSEVASVTVSRGGVQESAVIDVETEGAQLIVLRTEAGEQGSHGDDVLWLNARLEN